MVEVARYRKVPKPIYKAMRTCAQDDDFERSLVMR